MTRIVDNSRGIVHFRNPADDSRCLCGCAASFVEETLLSSHRHAFIQTSSPVNCPGCAKAYCAVKNEPWPSVDGNALDAAIYTATGPDTKGEERERGSEEGRTEEDRAGQDSLLGGLT